MSKFQVACFGEVLWDVFPTHEVIGGAPLNVALRLRSLGVKVAMISSIGNDTYGNEALAHLEQNGLDPSFVQLDDKHQTGQVIVSLDQKGSASYEIFRPVAWDRIRLDRANESLVADSDVFVFGSLACREQTSRETLLKLIERANFKVFDVNLRPPDYTMTLVLELMNAANFVKMNDEELEEICQYLDCDEPTLESQIAFISEKTHTSTICVTRGGDGAILFRDDQMYQNDGYKVVVEDTVGAGDSFLASLITKLLLQNEDPQDALDFACAVGSLVASKKGANSIITDNEIAQLQKS